MLVTGVLLVVRKWQRLDLDSIPTPQGWPLIGHIQILTHVKQAHSLLLKWHEQLGPVVRARVAHHELVFIADPAAAADVLTVGPNYCPKRPPDYGVFDAAFGFSGCSALMTHRDEKLYAAVRKAMLPAFSPAAVRQQWATMISCLEAACGEIAQHASITTGLVTCAEQLAGTATSDAGTAPSRPVELNRLLMGATLDVLVSCFLGVDCQGEAGFDPTTLGHEAGEMVEIVQRFVHEPWTKAYMWAPWLCKDARKLHHGRQALSEASLAIYDIIAARKRKGEALLPFAEGLLGVVHPKTGLPLTRDQVAAELALQMIGQESVPWTVAWALYLSDLHPGTERRLLDEMRAEGFPCDGDPAVAASVLRTNPDVLKRLHFMTAVVNETMRIYPAGVAAAPRLTDRPIKVGQYRIPAGVTVFPCLYTLLNYSANWQQPEKFMPERWMRPQSSIGGSGVAHACDPCGGRTSRRGSSDAGCPIEGAAGAFIPFSTGPKRCVGQHLALQQCKAQLALLLSCFSFRVASRMGSPGDVERRMLMALELRCEGGMWFEVQPRVL